MSLSRTSSRLSRSREIAPSQIKFLALSCFCFELKRFRNEISYHPYCGSYMVYQLVNFCVGIVCIEVVLLEAPNEL